MALPLAKPIDLYDYLAFENASELRHEYVGGAIHAMTGGTMRHNRISGNVFRELANRLDGSPCQVFINDMKLHVRADDSVYYPDVFVASGSPLAADERVAHDTSLIVEVLSDSTASTDRREKLASYQKLPSLRAYWIVSQSEQRVEVWSRAESSLGLSGRAAWRSMDYVAGQSIPDAALDDAPVPLATLYAGTDLAA